jgi:hypothetical protein
MAEFASAAEGPVDRPVIYTMGFEKDMVQHALALAGGNEQLAINLILNGEVHEAATASSSAASIVAPTVSFTGPSFGFGIAFAPAEVTSSSSDDDDDNHDDHDHDDHDHDNDDHDHDDHDNDDHDNDHDDRDDHDDFLAFPDYLTGRRVSISDGKLQSPAQLRAQIMRPLQLLKAAAWFFALQSPGMKRHREEPPPPLGYMLAEFSPCVPVRVMFGCVATACRRLVPAPAGVHVFYRTADFCERSIMERVMWGLVKKVQVWLQRHARCAVHCASPATACLRCVFDACCSKRWLVLRSVAPHRSGCIKRATAFILVRRLLPPPALQADPTL